MKRIKSREKIGRNDPCWCGSGKKYKKCHLGREDEKRIEPWQTDKEFKRLLEQGQCLAPGPWKHNCSPQIARAHTVPRSGSLKRIARYGHVYAYPLSFQGLHKTDGRVNPQLVGINRASTFTGFCSEHDRSIFATLEKMNFRATPEQCFLLCYRALCREFFIKQALAPMLEHARLRDRGKPLYLQYTHQDFIATFARGYSSTVKDLTVQKPVYDHILVTSDFRGVRAYIIEFNRVPPVMCSGGFYPVLDFEGHEIQDLADLDRPRHLITVTSFYGGHNGVIVLTWLEKDDPSCLPFVESLHRIQDKDLTNAVLRLLFTNFENIHIEPEWWESQSNASREALMERFNSSINALEDRVPLTDDGRTFDTWPVVARQFVGFDL
jgi:hypothetical protein